MNLDLKSLFDALAKASPRTKLAALVSAAAVVAVLAVAGLVASEPNFVMLYSGLDDSGRAEVEKALAGGGFRYKVSQPPGPYVVYVDEPSYYEAQNLVALSGSLKEMPRGIESGVGGATSIFLSSAERAQSMLKRDWQEMERQLETLDFVSSATVTTSMPETSPMRERKPLTVSVTLKLEGLAELSREQAENVAKLVRFRFNVPAENLMISDQSGRALFDPTDSDALGVDPESLLAYASRYDRDIEDKVNRQLQVAFGERKALVTIISEWDHDQRTSVAETLSPKGVLLTERNTKTETPQGADPAGAVGGPAGTASNLAPDSGFGVENASEPSEGMSVAASAPAATTSEVEKTWDTGRSKVQTVHVGPTLERLSVSLLVDDSLAAKKDEIASIVKAAVGFDTQRDDVLQVGTTTFATEPVDPAGAAAPEDGGGLSPMVEMLIRRSIEIVAALGCMLVLFKTLKGPKSRTASGNSALAGAAELSAGGDAEPDPELLARARIEELVRSDPRRVGEILSRWTSEDRVARAAK